VNAQLVTEGLARVAKEYRSPSGNVFVSGMITLPETLTWKLVAALDVAQAGSSSKDLLSHTEPKR
jgi:hypothetical protein